MKNTENKNENKLDLTKKFELDANAMNQIVGGTSFWMDTTPGTDMAVSDSADILSTEFEAVQTCDHSCKTCTTNKTSANIHICITKLKNK